MTINVPDQSFEVGSGLEKFQIDIKDLKCQNLTLGTVTSSVTSSATSPAYKLGLADIAINCVTESFDFRQVDFPHLQLSLIHI